MTRSGASQVLRELACAAFWSVMFVVVATAIGVLIGVASALLKEPVAKTAAQPVAKTAATQPKASRP